MFRKSLFVGAVGALALTLATPTSAPAHGGGSPTVSDPIVEGLAGPLQIDVAKHGTIYVTQSFAATLTKVNRDGTTEDLLTEPGGEARDVSGPAAGRYGSVAFASTLFDPAAREAFIKVRKSDGTVKTVADLWAYESRKNPDARNTYGFLDLTDECAAEVDAIEWPEGEEGPTGSPYTGIVDSHPYALANDGDGGWYVADAGINAILQVTKRGKISTVAVLPPQPTEVTAEAATNMGLPECTVGSTYAFEPVPTDVEVAKGGKLIVSLLPGGPEDPSLGARGAVYQVKAGSGGHHHGYGRHGSHGSRGKVKLLAGGFLGATNVAIGDRGEIYVAELFGGKVSVLKYGHVSTLAELTNPAGVEYKDGKVYVSYDVFANGSIASIKVRKRHHGHH
ncbi:MAG: ScyD/ScyE family protein [Nocardioides sp.]